MSGLKIEQRFVGGEGVSNVLIQEQSVPDGWGKHVQRPRGRGREEVGTPLVHSRDS